MGAFICSLAYLYGVLPVPTHDPSFALCVCTRACCPCAVLALFWRKQAAALEAESSYHHFENLTAIASAALERVRNEERWAKGQVSRGEGGAQAWAQAHYRRKYVFPPHPA